MAGLGPASQLEIGAWNIHGFKQNINSFKYNKLENPEFLKVVSRFSLFSLLETHHTAEEVGKLHIPDYKSHSLCRPKSKNMKRNKASGGISVYAHSSIAEGVKFMPESGTESVFVKLKKEYFDMYEDIFVCFSYLCPANSTVLNREFMPDDIFDDLRSKIAKYNAMGQVILIGDMNARTYGLCDYFPEDIPDNEPEPKRNNMDYKSNSYGRKFVDLCREVPLRILNGRFLGDFLGSLTSFNPRGSSCVDYSAVSPELLGAVWHFSVLPLLPTLADHCPIALGLKVGSRARQENGAGGTITLLPNPSKVKWNKNFSDNYSNIVQSRDVRNVLRDFVHVGILPDQGSVNSATSLLTKVMVTAAQQAGMQLRSGVLPRRQARQGQGYDRPKLKQPRWFDTSCHEAFYAVKRTSQLLAKSPRNPWLRGKLRTETKEYHRIIKYKQRIFINNLFQNLEDMDKVDPKGYMDLVRSLKNGNFDRKSASDTASVPADVWFNHFSDLLGKVQQPSDRDLEMREYINNNLASFTTDLDCPFSRDELKRSLKALKNNKATGFDMICNEMLKCAGPATDEAVLLLFNTVLTHNLYPCEWKKDICQPIFKSGVKTDPGNFRGLSVSSCFGKLFNSMLRFRLEDKCESLIRPEQASGQKGARTADHHLVLQHILQKYVRNGNNKLFACFIDLKKCYDNVSRVKLFYEILTEFQIGGKFLNILQNIYTNNLIFIKVDQGLLKPFTTTKGCKQGCNLSPLLYNMLTNRLPTIFNEACDPVYIGQRKLHCLSWADDCVLLSQSSAGLQQAINKTAAFFSELGLSMNILKTKCMVFNKRGLKAKAFSNIKFTANGQLLDLADQYTYLGLIIVPSGASSAALEELHAKASRAYFGISNILYSNRKMPVKRALKLLDNLVFPVSFYAAEYLTPLVLPAKSFSSLDNLLQAWETFLPERLNQRACRLLLSVHKKASRLAVLGDLGRFPVLLSALTSALKYSQVLRTKSSSTLASQAFSEMQSMIARGEDCWLKKVNSVYKLLDISEPNVFTKPKAVSNIVKRTLESKFSAYYLNKINEVKIGEDGRNHSKLQLYSSIKGSFKSEPYTEMVSRNQRSELSRVRLSAHHLRVETARYQTSCTDEYDANRWCLYCKKTGSPGVRDDEYHLFSCSSFSNQQRCLFGKISSISSTFQNLSFKDKVKSLLCPINAIMCRVVNKYIKIVFRGRDKINNGADPSSLTFPPLIMSENSESDSDTSWSGSETSTDCDG